MKHLHEVMNAFANSGLAGGTTHSGIYLWFEHEHLVCRQPSNWTFCLPISQSREDSSITGFDTSRPSSATRDDSGRREDFLHERTNYGRPSGHLGKRIGRGRFQMV